jgi:hypothetical protein
MEELNTMADERHIQNVIRNAHRLLHLADKEGVAEAGIKVLQALKCAFLRRGLLDKAIGYTKQEMDLMVDMGELDERDQEMVAEAERQRQRLRLKYEQARAAKADGNPSRKLSSSSHEGELKA